MPEDFYSDTEEKPFVNCKVCEQELTGTGVPYTIEKAFKRTADGEDVTLFEVAICIPCAEKQSRKMSKESRDYLASVMGDQGFFQKRQKLWENWQEEWKSSCIFSGNEVKENDEYHIVGHFQDGELLPQQAPFMIGQAMIEEIQENLSFETKEEMDRFGEQFLGPDPTIKALMEDSQFVLI